jgi:hypothetical protein
MSTTGQQTQAYFLDSRYEEKQLVENIKTKVKKARK